MADLDASVGRILPEEVARKCCHESHIDEL